MKLIKVRCKDEAITYKFKKGEKYKVLTGKYKGLVGTCILAAGGKPLPGQKRLKLQFVNGREEYFEPQEVEAVK